MTEATPGSRPDQPAGWRSDDGWSWSTETADDPAAAPRRGGRRQGQENGSRSPSPASASQDDRHPLHRNSLLRSLTPLLVGMLLGALLGLGAGLLTTSAAPAIARVTVLPDPSLPTEAERSSTEPDRFVQSQVLVLAGRDLLTTVDETLGLAEEPEVAATQVGTTDVVEVEVQAASTDVAVRVAQALVEDYRRQRDEELDARVDASLAVVDRQLEALDGTDDDTRADTEYSRLLEVRNQLQLIRDSAQEQVRWVEQPRAQEQSAAVAALRAAVMGLVLGALIGLLVKLLRDRSAARADGGRTTP